MLPCGRWKTPSLWREPTRLWPLNHNGATPWAAGNRAYLCGMPPSCFDYLCNHNMRLLQCQRL